VTSTLVTRTYLEMTSPDDLHPVELGDAGRVERVDVCPPSFYRWLYAEVGRHYRWTDRRDWSDDRIREHLADPGISVWVLYAGGAPAGWFELAVRGEATEIAYFGLLPEFIGRGLGKRMLTAAVRQAWQTGARRVWLHTCTLDDPAALPNYRKRGFREYGREQYTVAG
jgi:GNAT superfamily N-acetyltransferase